MRKIKNIIICLVLILGVLFVTGCDNSKKDLLKNNEEEAILEIKPAVQEKLVELYGDKIFDSRIYVEEVYSEEDEKENELVKSLNLSDEEIAFEVNIEIKPNIDVDYNEFLIPNGYYDEESGWVKNVHRVGILKYDSKTDKYIVSKFFTSF